jgi:hypothetical protein
MASANTIVRVSRPAKKLNHRRAMGRRFTREFKGAAVGRLELG